MLPLLLPSIPIGAVVLGIIIEAKEMTAIALLFAVVMWPIPAYSVAFGADCGKKPSSIKLYL